MKIEDIEKRMSEIKEEIEKPDADLEALNKEVDSLAEERTKLNEQAELRKKVAAGSIGTVKKNLEEMGETRGEKMNEAEVRANNFVQTGRMETRAVLSTGKIVKPTKAANEVNGLADVASGIVDDVNAISLTGNGAWTAAYKKTNTAAADVVDGSTVAGTGATYDYVTINPAEWGVLDEVSNQVKKLTSVDYQMNVENSAVSALRDTASAKIIAAVLASSLVEKKYSVKLDEKYIRQIVLGFRAITGKGNVSLYLTQADLATLGAVRGTAEKKPVYEITFDAGTTTSGTIQDGGMSVRFRVIDGLTDGTQLFGQPGAIDMPMWDNYTIATDEGGDYFKRNMIGVRGLQTANADLVALHGMQIISQSAQA